MEKKKRDAVSAEMVDSLKANREGRLTVDQWLREVTRPLIIGIALYGAGILVFGPRLLLLTARGLWIGLLIAFIGLIVLPLIFRARRYARMPIHFKRMYGEGVTLFTRRAIFQDEDRTEICFARRLAPANPILQDVEYVVYYLQDNQQKILLSYAPADHADVKNWLPTEKFDKRFQRRNDPPAST